jgi:hypothetical protein
LFIDIVGYSKLLIDDLAHLDNTVLMAMGKEPQRRYGSVKRSPIRHRLLPD